VSNENLSMSDSLVPRNIMCTSLSGILKLYVNFSGSMNLNIKLASIDSINSNIKAPGLLEAHYSPNAQVILDGVPLPGDGFIALADIPTPIGAVRLASPKDNNEYAQELYNALRLADSKGIETVQVITPIEQGIGVAINNRLIKSALN
jgi:hypothetical protein